MEVWQWIGLYLGLMSLVGMIAMGLDKKRAKKRARRLSERALFAIALLGGAFGTWAGMYIFRHKTKHWYFVVFMPLIFAAQIILCALCWHWFM